MNGSNEPTMNRILRMLGTALPILFFVNFTVFWFATLYIGGDGIGIPPKDGHYYVSSHGRLTEVSYNIWHYTRVHTFIVWTSVPLFFIGIVLYKFAANRMAAERRAADM